MNEDEQSEYDKLVAELATVKAQRDAYKKGMETQTRQKEELWDRINTMKDRRGTLMAGPSDIAPLKDES